MSVAGAPAVTFALEDVGGALHRLEQYRGRWLLMVFHRHLAWLPCREHLSQLRQHEGEIERLSLRVVVVTFEDRPRAEHYTRETALRWPLLIDRHRVLYQAYGMGQGRWWAIWGPATWRRYVDLVVRGRRLRPPTGDVYQLGGDVLVDPAGRVALHHVGRGPADRPAIAALLDRVKGELGQGPTG
jgi:peroxiredoxin